MKFQRLTHIFYLVAIDQLIKLCVYKQWVSSFIFGPIHITRIINTGITLGWLGIVPAWLLALAQSMIIMTIIYLPLPRLVKTLCLAGGLSNLIDRIVYHGVIDYIHFKLPGFSWPAIINIADLYITAALLLWIIQPSSENTGILHKRTLQSE